MVREESEIISAYLKSLNYSGGPSQKELDYLDRSRLWEKLMAFCEELEGAGLSPMCLPGWPCETCEERVGIRVRAEIDTEVGRSRHDPPPGGGLHGSTKWSVVPKKAQNQTD